MMAYKRVYMANMVHRESLRDWKYMSAAAEIAISDPRMKVARHLNLSSA